MSKEKKKNSNNKATKKDQIVSLAYLFAADEGNKKPSFHNIVEAADAVYTRANKAAKLPKSFVDFRKEIQPTWKPYTGSSKSTKYYLNDLKGIDSASDIKKNKVTKYFNKASESTKISKKNPDYESAKFLSSDLFLLGRDKPAKGTSLSSYTENQLRDKLKRIRNKNGGKKSGINFMKKETLIAAINAEKRK